MSTFNHLPRSLDRPLLTASFVTSMTCLMLTPGLCLADINREMKKMERHNWYLGIGVGISQLEPDTGDTIYSIDDKSSEGGKLYIGFDVSSHVSIEGYYSRLGKAAIAPNGAIDYEDVGFSAHYRFFKQNGASEGFSALLRTGVGHMMNSTNLPYERSNDAHLMFGAGLEYGLGGNWSLRADLDLYDSDSKLLTIGINKHLGDRDRTNTAPAETVATDFRDAIAIAPPALDESQQDDDADGVVNLNDSCQSTPAGDLVDLNGCSLPATLTLEGVTFATGSDTLTESSTEILDEVAAMLKQYPQVPIEVGGHTDWVGQANANQRLSKLRADAVRAYLVSQGLRAEQLTAVGYGESKPIADNHTPTGRAQNRRVELQLKASTTE